MANDTNRNHGKRWSLAPPLAALLLVATAGLADDTDFFANNFAPNVLLVLDSSGSMIIVVEHPYFDPASWPYTGTDSTTCDIIPDSKTDDNDFNDENGDPVDADCGTFCRIQVDSTKPGFVATSDTTDDPNQGYLERTFCGQTRKLWSDGPYRTLASKPTWWEHKYIEWYYSLDPSATYTHPDPGDDSTMTGQEIIDDIADPTNGRGWVDGDYYPLYQTTRINAAKRVAKEVMYRTNSDCPPYAGDCNTYFDRIRFGIGRFRGGHGGYVLSPPGSYEDNKSTLETDIDGILASGSTPLGETLYQTYSYFLHRTDPTKRPLGADATTRFPDYRFDFSGNYESDINNAAPDPWTEDCQRQFIVIVTDGTPNSDRFESTSGDSDHGFSDFPNLVGDYAPDVAGEIDWDPAAPAWTTSNRTKEEGTPPWESSAGGGYLDDIALFMQTNDARLDIPGDQYIDVYTVGFRTTGPVNDLLVKTARNGNGLAFLATETTALTDGLVDALAHIRAKTQSFTAATVPASRATDGSNFFTAYFEPSSSSAYWSGHLKLFDFTRSGEIRDKPTPAQVAASQPGDCALEDPQAPTRCAVGRVKIELDGYWDAANEIPAAGSRNLYASDYAAAIPGSIPSAPVAFNTTNITAGDLGLVNGDEAGYSTVTPVNTAPTDANGLATSLVSYARGCQFGTGSCIDRGAGGKLWDIFHANPVVVGSPNRGVRDDTYRAFVNRYKHRKRVIYAASNGLFVHGFNTGEYHATNTADFFDAPGFDHGDGVEEFGFMAYPARDKLVDLPIQHTLNMDGSPQASDVWLYEGGTSEPGDHSTLADWEEWRTVLIGGMREGGRVVWALDVTDPPDAANVNGQSTNIAYPGYLWEFPCEADDDLCNGTALPGSFEYADYMGETWSDPVITRVKVHVSCIDPDPADCDTYDRWVAIFGAGYDRQGDPNLTHDSTGVDVNAYDSSSDVDTSRAGRAIFMVDITSGKVLAMKRFDDSSATGETGMAYAITASPAVFDIDRDGYADVVYVGDLGGNLWKWVITDPVEDPINDNGDIDQPDWPFVKLFTADSCTSGAPHFRSFYSAPTGALVGSSLWLAWGSGERQELDFKGTRACEKNRFYVFKDMDPLEFEPPVSGRPYGDAADLSNADSLSGACNVALAADKKGYYVEGIHGEKFITESQIFFGIVLTGSFVPSDGTDACSTSGDAYLYGLNLFCGSGVFQDPADPDSTTPVRMVHIGSGLPNEPRVSVGPPKSGGPTGGGGGGDDCEDIVLVMTSDGNGFSDCPGGRPDSGVNLKSWRDE